MKSSEYLLDPDAVYDDIQGEIVPDDIPRRFSVRSKGLLRSEKEFKKELRREEVQEIVRVQHEKGNVIAARRQATEVIFDVAKSRKALVAGAVLLAGGAGVYQIFRKRRKQIP